tara:strand:- start:372 stop:1793 length:1422 start_codon:yes stop_codon:yes gene_type:complete
MIQKNKFYIDGKWVAPSNLDIIEVKNPSNEEIIFTVGSGTNNDVDKAVFAAKNAFTKFSKTKISERIELLSEIREVYKKRFEDIAQTISLEMGAPIKLARESQTKVGLSHLKTAINTLKNFNFEYVEKNYFIQKIPIGVCGLITPWNWPINQILSKLAFSLAAGCTSILKPSEIAPINAIIIAEILDEVGVPNGVFNLVNGYGYSVGEAFSCHPDIVMMSFTGSIQGGISVAKSSAESVKRVSQELGGKSANIIFDDDLFEKSVTQGVLSCMENSGQSCNAPTRMLIPVNRLEESFDIAKSTANALVVGDPLDEKTDLGPLSNENQFHKVRNLIQSGIKAGAKIITGGLNHPNNLKKGYFIEPTIFSHVTEEMEIFKNEIFGPVLTITHYNDYDHAIEIANNSEYGLAAYVSGQDEKKLFELSKNLNAGQIHINYTSGGTDAPFGGFKKSGNGREKGEWGLNEFLEVKAIIGG